MGKVIKNFSTRQNIYKEKIVVIQKKQVLLEVEKINRIIHGSKINEQLITTLPIMPYHTMKGMEKIGDWVSTWDKRDWLSFIEITSGLLTFIPGPTQPVFFIVSQMAGYANAKAAWDEGHKYEAGLIFTLTLLGANTTYRILKSASIYRKVGHSGTIELVEKVASGTATTTEKNTVKKIVQEIAPHADELAIETSKKVLRETFNKLAQKGLKYLVKFFIMIFKIGKFVTREGVVLSGTFLSYDKIYQALNYGDEQAMKERRHDPLVQVYNKVMNNQEEIIKQMNEQFNEEIIPEVVKNPKVMKKVLNIQINYDSSVVFPQPEIK